MLQRWKVSWNHWILSRYYAGVSYSILAYVARLNAWGWRHQEIIARMSKGLSLSTAVKLTIFVVPLAYTVYYIRNRRNILHSSNVFWEPFTPLRCEVAAERSVENIKICFLGCLPSFIAPTEVVQNHLEDPGITVENEWMYMWGIHLKNQPNYLSQLALHNLNIFINIIVLEFPEDCSHLLSTRKR